MLFYLKEAAQIILLKNIPFDIVGSLLFNATSWTFSYTIPMSSLLGIIIAVGNLNQKSEIIAMRAAGISFFQLIKPYLVIGTLFVTLLCIHQQKIVSQSYSNMEKILAQIRDYHIIAFIRPETFTFLDKNDKQYRILYVKDKIKRDGQFILKNIQIKTIQKTERGSRVVQFIIAKEAEKIEKKSKSGKKVNALRLLKGYAVMQEKAEKKIQLINFNNSSFDIHLIPPKNVENSKRKTFITEFSSDELLEKYQILKGGGHPYKIYIPYLTEYHKRIALSFSILFLILLGFPVSIVNQRTGKGFGLGLSLIFIFTFFTFYLSADTLTLKYSFLPPFVVAWLGNLWIGLLALYFFRKRLFLLT